MDADDRDTQEHRVKWTAGCLYGGVYSDLAMRSSGLTYYQPGGRPYAISSSAGHSRL